MRRAVTFRRSLVAIGALILGFALASPAAAADSGSAEALTAASGGRFVYLGNAHSAAIGVDLRAGGAIGSLIYRGRELVASGRRDERLAIPHSTMSVGPIHGGIFIAFVVAAVLVGLAHKWSVSTWILALLARMVPPL